VPVRLRRLLRRLKRSIRRFPWRSTGPVLAQAALLGAALVVLAWHGGGGRLAVATAVAGGLVGGSWLAPAVQRLVLRPLAYAIDLPGAPSAQPERHFSTRAWLGVSLLGSGAFVVLAVAGAQGWTFVAVAVGTGVGWLAVARDALRAEGHVRQLRGALKAYAPELALTYGGKSGGPWQLRMWEPYLLESGRKLVAFTLDEDYLSQIREGVTVPLVQLPGLDRRAFARLVVPSLHSFFYVQNASRNAVYLAARNVNHVWLGHGDSDKPASVSRHHNGYDRLLVSGQAAIDRYADSGVHIDPEKFVVVGRPQVSAVHPATGPIAELDHPVVLYAPTWQGKTTRVNFSSLPIATGIVDALIARGATVIFRPHPLSASWREPREAIRAVQALLRADRDRTGRPHRFGDAAEKDWTLVDCANHADALISDVSSVVSEFLQSTKPYAMVSMHADAEAFRAQFPIARTGYVLTRDLADLEKVLDDLLRNDPLSAAREETKRYVLGDFTGEESAAAFTTFVRSLGHRGRRPMLARWRSRSTPPT
jgi:hypothetical protein